MITKKSCTGCGACALLCPTQAIKMSENRLGEIVPIIKRKLCTGCNLCVKSCPQNNALNLVYPQRCFAAWSKNDSDWVYSASGGVGVSFLRQAISDGIVSFGCDYDNNMELTHFEIENEYDLRRSQSSKYSQSLSYYAFEAIKKSLIKNKQVIFIGTPCQVAGLKAYLKKDYAKLTTVDLICHGTPPNRYLKEHLNAILSVSKNIKASKVRFRGEYDQKLSVWDNSEVVYQKDRWDDIYFTMFYRNIISRDSCYLCPYARSERVSDITIGDFWGLKELSIIERKSERPSIVLLNTSKGESFFNLIKDELFFEERSVEEGVSGNGRLNSPPGKDFRATIFRFLYPIFKFEYSVKLLLLAERVASKIIKKFRGAL